MNKLAMQNGASPRDWLDRCIVP